MAHLTPSAKISTQWKSFDVSCQWQPKFILNVFNTCPAIMPLNLPYFNSVWIRLEEKNTLPLWTSFWIERTDNENSSKTACPWFGSRTVLSYFSEVNFNVPNLMKSTVVVCLKISTLSTSYRILTCPTRGSVSEQLLAVFGHICTTALISWRFFPVPPVKWCSSYHEEP